MFTPVVRRAGDAPDDEAVPRALQELGQLAVRVRLPRPVGEANLYPRGRRPAAARFARRDVREQVLPQLRAGGARLPRGAALQPDARAGGRPDDARHRLLPARLVRALPRAVSRRYRVP